MTVDQNKAIVTQTWQALVKGDINSAFANMSDEVSWLIPGNLPVSGLKRGKPAVLDFLCSAANMFPKGLASEIRRVYGEGDVVIVELTNRGKLANGRDYENEYCFIYEIEGGKIRRIREYVDTHRYHDLMS
jgi:uncharacterized protein